MPAGTSSSSSSSGGGLFSSLTSLFGGANLGEGPSGSSTGAGYADRKRSTFGSGLPTSVRRGPPPALDEDSTWKARYSPYSSEPNTASPLNGVYPPGPISSPATNDYPRFGSSTTRIMQSNPRESTSTLVSGAQPRQSLSLSTNVSIPSTAYPPLKHTWRRIRKWCDRSYTELADTLNWPATEAQLDDLELTIGFSLPPAVRDSYLCYDGQELESNVSCSDGLFFGLPLLSLDQIADEWRFWRNVDEDPTTGANPEVKGWMCSCPAGWVRSEYSCRGWIPLVTDHVGNYIGVDLSPNPGGGGAPGQVILFGRDFDTKIVLWRGEGEGGWGRFLQYIAEELESGELWTLEEEMSNDSNDEEDAIGYDSYFSGGGSGAGRGGGDRGGDGATGFKLRGEYKGWPVLEAWADRSMRCWEEIGMSSGQPAWRSERPPPSLVLQEAQGADRPVDENGEAMDAGGSSSALQDTVSSPSNAIGSNSSSSTAIPEQTRSGQSHPLESPSLPGTPTPDDHGATAARRAADTLSPPPMHAPRMKQKQREEFGSDPAIAPQARPRHPPPAPAAPLDLPTIDDVRAAHAAAMASQARGGNYHYDVERAARPPPGMGGMGMGMGVSSSSSGPGYVGRYTTGRTPAVYGPRRNGDVRMNLSLREEDGVELDNRSSTDVLDPTKLDGEQSMGSVDEFRRGSATFDASPRGSLNGLTSPSHLTGRTLYAASRSSEAVDTLIDASSSTDVSIQIEGTKAADKMHGNASTTPSQSSPLAKHSPAFASMGAASDAGREIHSSDSAAQPLTA